MMNKIVFAMSPFGYQYAVPFQIGYLKSFLNQYAIDSVCYDFNIDFHHKFDLIQTEEDFAKNAKKGVANIHYLEVNNWNDRNRFRREILPHIEKFIDECVEIIIQADPLVLGLSIYNSNVWFSIELLKRFKKKRPQVLIIFGGPEITIRFNRNEEKELLGFLEDNVDVFVVGEGEVAAARICRSVLANMSLKEIDGVKAIGKSFVIKEKFIENISTIPFPDLSDLDLTLYSANAMPLVLNRGCNHRCTFCEIENMWCNTVRTRTAADIFNEIIKIRSMFTGDVVFFHGAYVNVDTEVLDQLTNFLINEWGDHKRFSWSGWAKFHPNLTSEILQKMKHAGCYELVFGLESGSQKVINDMRKGFRVEMASQIIKDASKVGIDVTVFIIVGYPTETEDDFQATLEFLSRHRKQIKAAYCMSECILSDKMQTNPEKYGVKKEAHVDAFEWTSVDGLTYEERNHRLKRFYRHVEEIGLKHA